jgi:hypothetical protein
MQQENSSNEKNLNSNGSNSIELADGIDGGGNDWLWQGILVNFLFELGKAGFDTGKGVVASIFNNPLSAGLKSVIDSGELVNSMSYGAKSSLELALKNAQKTVELAKKAEKINSPAFIKIYRNQLSDVYKQMSTILVHDARNIEQKDVRTGAYARELAGAFAEISKKIISPNFPLPNLSIRDLRRSQGSLEKSDTAVNLAQKGNTNLKEALAKLERIRDGYTSPPIAEQSSTGNANLDKALAMLDQMNEKEASSQPIAAQSSTGNDDLDRALAMLDQMNEEGATNSPPEKTATTNRSRGREIGE